MLRQCYGDAAAVDDELVDVILRPGLEPGAVHVFLDFISYSSGPLPEQLLAAAPVPVSVVWGEEDPWEKIEWGREFAKYDTVQVGCRAGEWGLAVARRGLRSSPAQAVGVQPASVDWKRGPPACLRCASARAPGQRPLLLLADAVSCLPLLASAGVHFAAWRRALPSRRGAPPGQPSDSEVCGARVRVTRASRTAMQCMISLVLYSLIGSQQFAP